MKSEQRCVLITGGTGNLGKVVVERFLSDCYRVFMAVSPGKKSKETRTGIVELEADLTNEEQAGKIVDQVIDMHGTIDAALLLVGGFAAGKIDETTGGAMQKMFSLNF